MYLHGVRQGVSKSFADRADSACFWEAWVGAVLGRAGLYILHHPFVADGGDYHALSWDLDVNSCNMFGGCGEGCYKSDGEIPVECKSLSLFFTRAEDYPNEPLFVCSQNSWMNKWTGKDRTQRDFLFISRQTGAIVWLPVGTPVTLGHDAFDSSRGNTYKVVVTEKKYLKELGDFVEYVKKTCYWT